MQLKVDFQQCPAGKHTNLLLKTTLMNAEHQIRENKVDFLQIIILSCHKKIQLTSLSCYGHSSERC